MRRPEFIAEQSRRPSGALGWLLGTIMSHETASLNSVALTALELRPADHVLEIGFGHGRTIQKAAEIVKDGFVAGVDFSETMLGMASRRCSALVATGRLRLDLADSAELPFPDEHFDKAYSVHTLYFWKDPAAHLREIRRVLRPGGLFAFGFRTKDDGGGTNAFPGAVYTFYGLEEVRGMLGASGFAGEILEVAHGGSPSMAVLVAARDAVP